MKVPKVESSIGSMDVQKRKGQTTHQYGDFESSITWITRSVVLMMVAVCCYYIDTLQRHIDYLWIFCLNSSVYNSVYFETWFATFCYAVIIPVYPFALHYLPFLDRYKVDPTVKYVHMTTVGMVRDAIMYMSPLMLMDTFMVKKYSGTEPTMLEEKRKTYIQTTRVLPQMSPTIGQVTFQLVASILLYDFLFFCVHFALHKNAWLYKHVHALHHKHDNMHAHVTNQLTMVERIVLILSANFALKVFHSHPLTRTIFIPVFVYLLVDNHSGYDLPFGLHRIFPSGILGGPAAHYSHHLHGSRHYQPFLTYLDQMIVKNKRLF